MALPDVVYEMYFDDYNGNECTVLIKQDGYAGAATLVNGGPDPCIVKLLGDGDDKFVHIKATECVLQLVSTTSLMYLSLFTSPVKTYWCEVYRGVTLIWIGWVNPEYYSEPLLPAPYVTTVHCTDGLAELKNIDFPIPGYNITNFKQTVMHYISTCLTQIGLGDSQSIYVASNIIANCPTTGQLTSRVFDFLFMDYRAFQNEDGTFFKCYEVLNEVLATFNCRLYQNGWVWWVERIDHKHTTFRVEQYLCDGTYVTTTAAYDAVVSLTAHVGKGTDIRFINTPAMLEVKPAYKEFDIIQDYGNRTNLIDSTSYKPFQANDWLTNDALRFWTEYGSIDHTREINFDAMRIKGIYTSVSNYIASNVIYVQNEGVNSLDNLMTAWRNGEISLIFSFDVGKRYYARRPGSNTFIAGLILQASFSGTVYRAENVESEGIIKRKKNTKGINSVLGILSGLGYWGSIFPKLAPANRSNTNSVSVENLESTGWFYPAENLNKITINLKDTNDWVNTTVEFGFPPEAEIENAQTYINFQIFLLQCETNLDEPDLIDSDGLLYRNMRLYFKNNLKASTIDTGDNTDDYIRTLTNYIDVKNIVTPQPYMVKFGNTPSPWGVLGAGTNDGYSLINKNVIFDVGGKPVNYFGLIGDTHVVSSLVDTILASDLNIAYRRPLFVLRGTIIDTTDSINFVTILKDYDNRYYYWSGSGHNLKKCTFEGEWVQMWSDDDGEFSDDFSDDFWI